MIKGNTIPAKRSYFRIEGFIMFFLIYTGILCSIICIPWACIDIIERIEEQSKLKRVESTSPFPSGLENMDEKTILDHGFRLVKNEEETKFYYNGKSGFPTKNGIWMGSYMIFKDRNGMNKLYLFAVKTFHYYSEDDMIDSADKESILYDLPKNFPKNIIIN